MAHLRQRISGPVNALTGSASELPAEIANDPVVIDAQVPVEKVRDQNAAAQLAVDALGAVGTKVGAQDLQAHRVPSTQNPHSVLRTNETVRGGRALRGMMQKALAQLADTGFSTEGQKDFVQQVCREAKTKWQPGQGKSDNLAPEHMCDLAWLASNLRKVAPGGDAKLDTLNEFFGDHGFKLQTLGASDKDHFAQLDRGKFRETLRQIRDKGGNASARDMRHLLGQLSNVYDIDDMRWAQSQLRVRVMAGQIRVPREVQASFDDFMGKHIDTNADVGEIAFQARALRLALNSGDVNAIAEQRDRFNALVKSAAQNSNDPDALFYARRVIDRELGKKCAGNSQARALCQGLTASITAKVGDKLDRYSMNKRIESLLASGEITQNEAYVMRVGVVTSSTRTELVQTLNYFDATLQLEMSDAILKAMEEVSETISRNMSDDTLDAHGNVIETAAQREERAFLRRKQTEQVLRRAVANDIDSRVSSYRAASSSALEQAAAAPTAAERGSLIGRAQLYAGEARVVQSRRG